MRDLILNKCDVHHIFPRNHLKGLGLSRGRYNQIANYVITQSEINIAIGDKSPTVYFPELTEQCQSGRRKYGGITELEELRVNLQMNCIPEEALNGGIGEYDSFLEQRRRLMAARVKEYFHKL